MHALRDCPFPKEALSYCKVPAFLSSTDIESCLDRIDLAARKNEPKQLLRTLSYGHLVSSEYKK